MTTAHIAYRGAYEEAGKAGKQFLGSTTPGTTVYVYRTKKTPTILVRRISSLQKWMNKFRQSINKNLMSGKRSRQEIINVTTVDPKTITGYNYNYRSSVYDALNSWKIKQPKPVSIY